MKREVVDLESLNVVCSAIRVRSTLLASLLDVLLLLGGLLATTGMV